LHHLAFLKMPGAARGRSAQKTTPRTAQHKLLDSLSKTSQSMSKTRSLDQIQAMMDSSDDDENNKISPPSVNLTIRTISKQFVECDNCGSKFRGEIPGVHLMECKNIPIKEEEAPSIDELDDSNFMPRTPETTQDEPIFKLGSNYPSGFGMLLVNALQNDLAHNGIDVDEHGNETGEVQWAPEKYVLDQKSLDKELEAEIIEIRESSFVSTTINKENRDKTVRKRAKTPPDQTSKISKISKITDIDLNSDTFEKSTPDSVSTKKPVSKNKVQKSPENNSPSARAPLANVTSQSPAKAASTKPAIKPNFKPNVPKLTTPIKPTLSKTTTTPTGIAQTWYKLKKGDIIFCLWCRTEMDTSTTTTCVCTHENYHVKKIKQFSMPSFLLNNEKLKSKPGYSDFTKDWMICYRCGMCLTKDRKKLLAHVTKKHDNGDERESCHYCPKKFFDDEEAFGHENAG